MDKFEEELNHEYTLAQCKHQILLYQCRQTRMNTPLQRYFNSTPARNAFARVMFVAAHDNTVYTKTGISRILHITRQATALMIDDCIAEGWVVTDAKSWKASQILIDAQYSYAEFHKETLIGLPVSYYLQTLEHYQKAKALKESSQFTLDGVAR